MKISLIVAMSENRVIHCEGSDAAATRLTAMLQPGDVVLVKGSRGVRTDLVVARLEACGRLWPVLPVQA